jgi:NTP pyrophosphatase (non-canonical NTP hydrolase)
MKEYTLNDLFSTYSKFIEGVTSPASADANVWIEKIKKLDESCNASLLMTAGNGMADEGGEFAGIVKKLNFQGKELTDDVKFHLKRELGDVIFYWIMGCQALDLKPEDVIMENINKLSSRYPGGFDAFKSEHKLATDL